MKSGLKGNINSLRSHLLNWLFTPLFVLWVFSITSGYMATQRFADEPYDLALLEHAQALAKQLGLGSGKERLDAPITLPKTAGGGERGHFYLTLSTPEGRKLAGNAHLSRPPASLTDETDVIFSNTQYGEEKLRMVTLRFPYSGGGEILLQLAETNAKRHELARGILINIVIPQLLLILLATAALWFMLKKGLAPLEHLRQDVELRPSGDLSLIEENQVPEEVRPLIRAFNSLLQRFALLLEAQKRFVADAAHQLRTPFAGIQTQAELGLRNPENAQKQHALALILTGAERCSHLVNQLLVLARNEPGALHDGSLEIIDLKHLAQETAMQWVPAALQKRIDLGFEEQGKTLAIRGNAAGLTDMVNNLLDNAIRYTPEGGMVTLCAGEENGAAWLRVEDNGPGIAPEYRAQVFERFFRILGSGQEGSGLGLSIVREIASQHGATIELDSGAGGKGTRITLRFPPTH